MNRAATLVAHFILFEASLPCHYPLSAAKAGIQTCAESRPSPWIPTIRGNDRLDN